MAAAPAQGGWALAWATSLDQQHAAASLHTCFVQQFLTGLYVLQDVWGAGCVTLVGDAEHAMLPALGQGACQAIEDAVELAVVSMIDFACCLGMAACGAAASAHP